MKGESLFGCVGGLSEIEVLTAMRSTQFRQLARRIMTHEQRTEQTSHEVTAFVVRIYTKLLACLSTILGEAGGLALFRRSLRLTEATFPLFSAVRDAKANTVLSAVSTCLHAQPADVAHEASMELLAIHLELLATFLGQRVTDQIVREVWPDLPPAVPEEHHA
jgi:hypothetical protein